MTFSITRRRLLIGSAAGLGAIGLTGCDDVVQNSNVQNLLAMAEKLTIRSQRLLVPKDKLAREFSEADISPIFKPNGTSQPDSEEYARMMENGFADWRLKIDGLVERPVAVSLGDLKRLPSRTQITRHDCVEGWSAIGKWGGAPFHTFLDRIGADRRAKYVGFKCADKYYTSIDMPTALHPQTLLALDYGDAELPTKYGYPLKLRVPTKLGFKNPKLIAEIYVTNDFPGGYWEDQGYNWFSGS